MNKKPEQPKKLKAAFLNKDKLLKFLDQCTSGTTVEDLENLVKRGADVNAVSAKGETCLGKALQKGRDDLALALVQHGANPNQPDPRIVGSFLLSACVDNMRQDLIEALLKNGANIHVTDMAGRSPLFFAAYHNRADAFYALLDAGADINQKDFNNNPTLHILILNKRVDGARLLINAGADIHVKTEDGHDALIFAAAIGNATITFELILAGANLKTIDDEGYCALDWAHNSGDEQTIMAITLALHQEEMIKKECLKNARDPFENGIKQDIRLPKRNP